MVLVDQNHRPDGSLVLLPEAWGPRRARGSHSDLHEPRPRLRPGVYRPNRSRGGVSGDRVRLAARPGLGPTDLARWTKTGSSPLLLGELDDRAAFLASKPRSPNPGRKRLRRGYPTLPPSSGG